MQYRGKSRPGSYIGDPLGTCCHVDQTWRFQAFLEEQGKVVISSGDVYHREIRALHRISSMEYSTLRALHEKPDKKYSKHAHFTHSRTRERREVYDGPGTVISVKKSEW